MAVPWEHLGIGFEVLGVIFFTVLLLGAFVAGVPVSLGSCEPNCWRSDFGVFFLWVVFVW